jgi:rfaE bifunctional protein nucleotidyltransferase chain/domain
MNTDNSSFSMLERELGNHPGALHVVCGTYDFLQPGNLATLDAAKQADARLLLVLAADDDVRAWSGRERPFHTAGERQQFAQQLAGIHAVTVVESSMATHFFNQLPPFTLFSCAERPGPLTDAALAAARATQNIPFLAGCSTPDVVAAIQSNHTPITAPGKMPSQHHGSESPHVTVNGCFDILHLGHLDMLSKARAMGGRLSVLINSDESVRRYKGDTRPVFPESFRARALLSLRAVDSVYCFTEDNPLALLDELKPDIHVKGGSYEPERVQKEKALLESWGGRVEFCPLLEGYSTSSIIQAAG